jgi:SPP1 family predicted phage head-tail adaptor
MLTHRLRHAIEFQIPVETVNEKTGARNTTWQTAALDGRQLKNYPAEVLTGPGRDLIAAQAPQNKITARINVPWFNVAESELATFRILWDGRIYQIEGISTDLTARMEWRLQCSGGVADNA